MLHILLCAVLILCMTAGTAVISIADDAAYTSVRKRVTTGSGQTREVFVSGLKGSNTDYTLDRIAASFDGEEPLKLEDEAYVDAEKWDLSLTDRGSPGDFDTGQCWAASASNMLEITGWHKRFTYPEGMESFQSEDDIFRYYNLSFSNAGNNIEKGIDWIFMREFADDSDTAHANPLDTRSGGLMPRVVSTLMQNKYDLTKDPKNISVLEKIAPASGESGTGQSVFQGSIGTIEEGSVLSRSSHSVNVSGLISDPDASDPGSRYKAVIITDSDNDAKAGEGSMERFKELEEKLKEAYEVMDIQKIERLSQQILDLQYADKKDYTNSMTVYPLRQIDCRTADGKAAVCWEIVGYDESAETPWIIYSVNELQYPSDELINEITETEGSANVLTDPDLLISSSYMTGSKDPYITPSDARRNEVRSYGYGKPVYLNYFIGNAGYVDLDEEYLRNKGAGPIRPELRWVVRDSKGNISATGTDHAELPLTAVEGTFMTQSRVLKLNDAAGGTASLKPGVYTVTLTYNESRSIPEAYYRNNRPHTLSFTIKGGGKPSGGGDDIDGKDKTPSGGSQDRADKTVRADTGDDIHEVLIWLAAADLAALTIIIILLIRNKRTYKRMEETK